MMAKERAVAVEARRPQRQENNRGESITPEPSPATCAGCTSTETLYIVGAIFLCVGCIAQTVSMAACDIWPDAISYSREFERVLIYG